MRNRAPGLLLLLAIGLPARGAAGAGYRFDGTISRPVLELGFSDGIYGRSKGGTTFSGWACDHLPCLVEPDNRGVSRRPGEAGAGGIRVWGCDEITWFAHQSGKYRADWLRYARDRVRRTDPACHLEMPGSRTIRSPLDHRRWYYANAPGPAVPEGLDDEAAIRALWADDTGK